MKKWSKKAKIIAALLVFALALLQAQASAQAAVRKADVSTPGSGNVLVGVTGTFENVSKSTILKRINQIRKEACQNGYINPSTGKKLTSSDYVAIKWSSDLEWIAQLRAAECTVYESHTRPNGSSCFSAERNGEGSWAENLAWNYSGLMSGIEQWYSEKEDWVNQNSSAMTGHYTSLINPRYKYIGLGSFIRSTGGWYGVSAEFSYKDSLKEKKSKLEGKKTQTIEVEKSTVSGMELSAPSSVKVGQTANLSVKCQVSYPSIMEGTNATEARVLSGIKWKSSKPAVLSVGENGKVTAKKAGKAVITAKGNGKTFKKTITVEN